MKRNTWQREAVRALRTELASLSGAVGGLDAGLQGYRRELDRTALSAAAARAGARRLDATADRLLAACRG